MTKVAVGHYDSFYRDDTNFDKNSVYTVFNQEPSGKWTIQYEDGFQVNAVDTDDIELDEVVS